MAARRAQVGPDVGRPVGDVAAEETVLAARHHRRIHVLERVGEIVGVSAAAPDQA
jgi:hypothetical protein